MGRVGVLTQGCLSPEPRFTLPPWSGAATGGRREGLHQGAGASWVGSPETVPPPRAPWQEGAAAADQAGRGNTGARRLVGAVYQPVVWGGVSGASCADLPRAALAQSRASPQQPPDWGQPQGHAQAQPKAGGAGGKVESHLWADQWPGDQEGLKALVFSPAQASVGGAPLPEVLCPPQTPRPGAATPQTLFWG